MGRYIRFAQFVKSSMWADNPIANALQQIGSKLCVAEWYIPRMCVFFHLVTQNCPPKFSEICLKPVHQSSINHHSEGYYRHFLRNIFLTSFKWILYDLVLSVCCEISAINCYPITYSHRLIAVNNYAVQDWERVKRTRMPNQGEITDCYDKQSIIIFVVRIKSDFIEL